MPFLNFDKQSIGKKAGEESKLIGRKGAFCGLTRDKLNPGFESL